jgi:hypothetical protein
MTCARTQDPTGPGAVSECVPDTAASSWRRRFPTCRT